MPTEVPTNVRHIEVRGLYGDLDMELEFFEDVNVLYGRNGSGKTTLLHILANVLRGSLTRFAYLDFSSIRVETNRGTISIAREPGSDRDDDLIRVSVDGSNPLAFTAGDIRRQGIRRQTTEREQEQSSSILGQITSYRDELPVDGAAYFPAFRTMIEAWWSIHGGETERLVSSYTSGYDVLESFPDYVRTTRLSSRSRSADVTEFARDLFGRFLPVINFPSPQEIESRLTEKVRSAGYEVARRSQDMLTQAFIDAFGALSRVSAPPQQTTERILLEIQDLLQRLDQSEMNLLTAGDRRDLYRRLRERVESIPTDDVPDQTAASVLSVYRRSLIEQLELQRSSFAGIQAYIDSVNQFLEGKALTIVNERPGRPVTRVQMAHDGHRPVSIRALSSGERQIISMLYAASNPETGGVVLIDEPEISLHIDWQRMLLPKMVSQLEGRQVIVCTHSPEIGAEYRHRLKIVELVPAARAGAQRQATDSLGEEDALTEHLL